MHNTSYTQDAVNPLGTCAPLDALDTSKTEVGFHAGQSEQIGYMEFTRYMIAFEYIEYLEYMKNGSQLLHGVYSLALGNHLNMKPFLEHSYLVVSITPDLM